MADLPWLGLGLEFFLFGDSANFKLGGTGLEG